MRSRVILFVALLLGAGAPAPRKPAPPSPAPPPPTADQQFDTLAKRYLDEMPQVAPTAATSLGDHRSDAQLAAVSASGWQARVAFASRYLAALEPLELAKLSRANQVDA